MDFESVRVGNFDLYRMTEMPTYNKRFGAMAGVTPQKVQCEIER